MIREVIKRRIIKIISVFFIFTISIIFLLGFSIFFYQKAFSQKIYLGVKIGEYSLGGKTKKESELLLKRLTQEINQKGLTFNHQNQKVIVPSLITAPLDPDIAREIFSFNNQTTIDYVYSIGRNKTFFQNTKEQIETLVFGKTIKADYRLNKKELEKILKENFKDYENPAENAKLQIDEQENIVVLPEKTGQVFYYSEAIKKTEENLSSLKNVFLNLSLIADFPVIHQKETEGVLKEINKILGQAPFTLKYQEKKWIISRKTLSHWLEFKKDSKVTLNLNETSLNRFLTSLHQKIYIPSRDAKFKLVNNRVKEFQAERDGLRLPLKENYQKINNQIINGQTKEIELIAEIIKAKIATEKINDLGIKELIGAGKSNFSGSPVNRRHNIKTGADALNGLLIKPKEEFSLNKALGEINAQTGYLPESVIKGNKTVPEYGGGLCQVATTLFRTALNAGLPITERQEHTYLVSYYEPAGTDATIYNPSPDLKFINDTGRYILIQTKIQGNDLIFEFWGTSDGRIVKQSQPKIFNLVNPGQPQIIKTDNLLPGEKKCIEIAHTGANAEFTRTIIYPNGQEKKETWKSFYRPWNAVCLVGKKEEERKNGS